MKLNPKEIQTAYFIFASMIRGCRDAASRPVSDLYDRLEAEFHRLAQPRHETDSGPGDPGESKWMGASEAAELLSIPLRTVQRNYEVFGGEKVSDTLVFDRATILEHARRDCA